jgi:nicotinamidase-related amidase
MIHMEEKNGNVALLVMDMQKGILKNYPSAKTQIANVKKAIDAARKKGVAVLYVRVGLRPGLPEINPNNKMFSGFRERIGNDNLDDWMEIENSIAPLQNEIVVNKKRVSAFTGSDLEVLLRSKGIQHIVLSGVSTSGVVLSTLREAADKDYHITVLSDCCLDPDEEVHRVLTTKIFPRQADVKTADEWING